MKTQPFSKSFQIAGAPWKDDGHLTINIIKQINK